MILSLVLAGWMGCGALGLQAQEAQDPTAARKEQSGEASPILKLTRDMVALARSHDCEGRMDLFLGQARECLRQREAMEKQPGTPEGREQARDLAGRYALLVSSGAAGAIECGAAEGRDMSKPIERFVDSTREDHGRWVRIQEDSAPEERPACEGALRASARASERAAEAKGAGLRFLAQERAKKEARTPPADPPKPPAPPAAERKPDPPPQETKTAPKPPPPPTPPAAERERRGPESEATKREESDPPRVNEHHSHPHRPHR